MSASQTLLQKASEATNEALKALVAGNATEAERLDTVANEYTKNAQKALELEARQKDMNTPVLPVGFSYPTGGGEQPKPETKSVNNTIHQLKYGNEDEAVKAVCRDIHGPAFDDMRYGQEIAFARFLRGGKESLNNEQHRLLKSIIVTPRMAKLLIAEGGDIAAMKSTMVEAIDTLGGYAVPVDLNLNIIERMAGLTAVRPYANVVQTNRDRVQFLVRDGGDSQFIGNVRGTWVSETPAAGAAETNAKFKLEDIPVHTFMASIPISKNLMEDSAFPIMGVLSQELALSFAISEDNAFLTGDGVGKPQGILPGGLNTLTIAEVNSGAAATITWAGLIALSYGVDTQYAQNAVFVAERATWAVAAALADLAGQTQWRRELGNGVTEGKNRNRWPLFEYPTLQQESLPSLGAGNFPIVFGDLKGYTIVDRVGMTVDRYDDATTAETNSIKIVARRRVGGQVTAKWMLAVQKCSA